MRSPRWRRSIPPRRVGRRRHRRRLAEGSDAAAGPVFNAISEKAMAANETARLPRNYWDWQAMLATNATGYFPYTPAINLLFGLREAIDHAARGRATPTSSPAMTATPRRRGAPCVPGAWRSQCAEPLDYSSVADRGATAGGSQRRPAARDHSGEVQHVAWHRPRQAPGPGVPHRPSRRFRRPAVDGHVERRRDGAACRRRAAPGRRGTGGDGLSGRQCVSRRRSTIKPRE